MTISQYKKKFPERLEEINDDNLEDAACPKCGSRDKFVTVSPIEFEITDDNLERTGEFDWDAHTHLTCGECGYKAKREKFHIKGLDNDLSLMTDV